MQTNIVQWGNSRGVRLSKKILKSVNIADNDPVEISTKDGCIIIKKFEDVPFVSIEELFKDYEGVEDPCGEIDWGKPVGKEIW